MNKRFGKVCVATAGALGAAVSVLSAGPALAADQSVTIANCNWREGDEFGPYTLGVGDTLTVTFTTPGNCAIARADADMDFGTLTVTDTNGGTRILTAGQEYAPGSSSIASLAF